MHLPNILHFMRKHCLSLPPPRISQLRHIHKFMHNNSAGTLFSTAPHILCTRLKTGNLISHTRNAALIIKPVTTFRENTKRLDVCCQLEPDVTCSQPICISLFQWRFAKISKRHPCVSQCVCALQFLTFKQIVYISLADTCMFSASLFILHIMHVSAAD